MLGLTRNNCDDLGFAILCYERNAADKKEFLDWLYGIVRTVPAESFPTNATRRPKCRLTVKGFRILKKT
ncbi:hypothetical protein F7O43_10990 [Neisseria meningitidis]|nr:hypothetical protein [Neisseria meningitidis]MBG8694821.1 hypothetical protein [Neisseria meningitidis]MBG8806463.1 hypothetical protein [Neisseria meningitidis]MBG8948823.1 hypothetical protein [Neisseria meningitidis]MBJ7815976.1 hypothetical protein [Neisseria meningitidis]